MTQLALPAVYVIEPTNRCNMDCLMCPNDQQVEKGDITSNLLLSVASQIRHHAQYIQLYFAGEPTLHDDLPALIRLVKARTRARVELSTNLLQLRDAAYAQEVLTSGLDVLIGCIDGASSESYRALRRADTFDLVVDIMHSLATWKERHRLEIDLVAKCIETTWNTTELADFVEYWQNVPGIRPHVSWLNTWGGSMPHLDEIMVHGCPNADSPRRPCAELWNKLVIRWNGHVVLCCHDWRLHVVLGNAREESLGAIWNAESLLHFRREHISGIYPGICAVCREWSLPEEYIQDYGIARDDLCFPPVSA